jgi:hypothetical protein
MEMPWFNECSLADCDKHGSSAYFVPQNRMEELYSDYEELAHKSVLKYEEEQANIKTSSLPSWVRDMY